MNPDFPRALVAVNLQPTFMIASHHISVGHLEKPTERGLAPATH